MDLKISLTECLRILQMTRYGQIKIAISVEKNRRSFRDYSLILILQFSISAICKEITEFSTLNFLDLQQNFFQSFSSK